MRNIPSSSVLKSLIIFGGSPPSSTQLSDSTLPPIEGCPSSSCEGSRRQ
jgi:hypothetical protein